MTNMQSVDLGISDFSYDTLGSCHKPPRVDR